MIAHNEQPDSKAAHRDHVHFYMSMPDIHLNRQTLVYQFFILFLLDHRETELSKPVVRVYSSYIYE